jgi:hypothetical protein
MLEPCFARGTRIQEVGESSTGLWYLVQGAPDAACAARGDAGRALYHVPPGIH